MGVDVSREVEMQRVTDKRRNVKSELREREERKRKKERKRKAKMEWNNGYEDGMGLVLMNNHMQRWERATRTEGGQKKSFL